VDEVQEEPFGELMVYELNTLLLSSPCAFVTEEEGGGH